MGMIGIKVKRGQCQELILSRTPLPLHLNLPLPLPQSTLSLAVTLWAVTWTVNEKYKIVGDHYFQVIS